MSIDPIERGLEQSFELEKWGRFIRECDDIDTLRETALSLVQQLAQLKASSAWMASRASESENANCPVRLDPCFKLTLEKAYVESRD